MKLTTHNNPLVLFPDDSDTVYLTVSSVKSASEEFQLSTEVQRRFNSYEQHLDTIVQKENDVKNAKEQIQSLFERITGVPVSEYDSEQLDYLADYIEGELDANEGCIAKLKKGNAQQAERIKQLELLTKSDNIIERS